MGKIAGPAIAGAVSILLIFSQVLAVYGTPLKTFREYSIEIGPYELYGRLTMPNGVEQPPVAVFIHGSGQWNYNSAFGGMKMFKDIAHGLAEQGIASIRHNKRYYQHPPMPHGVNIWNETIYDTSHAIKFTAAQEDLGEIFIIGFSQGGIVAPHLAYAHPEVKGIISLAGSPRSFFEIIASQSEFLRHRAAGLGVNIPARMVATLLNQIMNIDENILPVTYNFLSEQALSLGFPISFLHSMNNLDTYRVISYIEIPFLILQGEEDLQIHAEYDFTAWKELLYEREHTAFILYEGLNHFFAPHIPELGFNQSAARANVDAQVIKDIAEWIIGITVNDTIMEEN